MAFVSSEQFARSGKTVRVKLLADQKIRNVALSKGDTCDLTVQEAVYLKSIGRVEDAPPEEKARPVKEQR